MKSTRRNHGAAFNAKVAMAALKSDKALSELAEHVGVHPTQITDGNPHVLARASDMFGGTTPKLDEPDLKSLHATIGPLMLRKPPIWDRPKGKSSGTIANFSRAVPMRQSKFTERRLSVF